MATRRKVILHLAADPTCALAHREPAASFVCARYRGCTCAKARGQQVELGRFAATRRRLEVPDRRKIPLERGEQRGLGAALQHLAEKGTAGRKHLPCEVGR